MKVPGCYAAPLDDCDGPLTREHAFSENVLEYLNSNKSLMVKNERWPDGRLSAPNDLAARVLCKHHNSMLSDLDTELGRFFPAAMAPPTVSARPLCIDGLKVERYMLKWLLGHLAGQKRCPELFTVTNLERLYGRAPHPEGVGLYGYKQRQRVDARSSHVHAAVLIDAGGSVAGACVSTLVTEFCYVLQRPVSQRDVMYRPNCCVLRRLGTEQRTEIRLSWEPLQRSARRRIDTVIE